ncbi:hypothetical protein R2362_23910 [Mycobacteroides chelonae]|jgi:hypothetical protein|nr:hypothetical protein [Mycobacteroides chelonae]
MPITIDGNDIVMTGVWRLVNGFNAETGMAYLIGTPDGGVGMMPFVSPGVSGPPSPPRNIIRHEVPAGEALPPESSKVIVVDPGGPGEAAVWDWEVWLHAGEDGPPGVITLMNASDLEGTVNDGSIDGYTIVKKPGENKGMWVARKVGDWWIPGASALTPKAFNATSPHTLVGVGIPPQKFDWRPEGYAIGQAVGSTDTRVDFVARVGTQTGHECGYARGMTGAAPPPLTMLPLPPLGSDLSTYGRVSAGVATTVYFMLEQKNSSSNSWSMTPGPDTRVGVKVCPIP